MTSSTKHRFVHFVPAVFSQIDFLSKRAGYDGQERAHGGLELCDQERQKDLQGKRAAGRRRQGLVLGYLELGRMGSSKNMAYSKG